MRLFQKWEELVEVAEDNIYKIINLIFIQIKIKQFKNRMFYILRINNNIRALEKSIEAFNGFTKNKYIAITESKFVNYVAPKIIGNAKYLHYLTPELAFFAEAIFHLGNCIYEICLGRTTWKETFQETVKKNLFFSEEEIDIEKIDIQHPESILRHLSARLIRVIESAKDILKEKESKFEECCRVCNEASYKLVDKRIGPHLISFFEEGLANGKKQGKSEKYLNNIRMEMKMLKHFMQTNTNTLEELGATFITNIHILSNYVYVMFIKNILKLRGTKEDYLVIVDVEKFSIFGGIIAHELKKYVKRTRIFGIGDDYEYDKSLEKLLDTNLRISKQEYEENMKQLLEEEEREKEALQNQEKKRQEKNNKLQINKALLEKERLKQVELEKERLKQVELEKERLKQVELEKERLEKERLKQAELAKERLKQAELAKERLEKERLKQAELAKERLEKERLAKERLEKERLAKEIFEKEKLKQAELAKAKQKLNVAAQEFHPIPILETPMLRPEEDMNLISQYIPSEYYELFREQVEYFKEHPESYFYYPHLPIFQWLEHFPQLFHYSILQAYNTEKRELYEIFYTLQNSHDAGMYYSLHPIYEGVRQSLILSMKN